MAVLARCNFAVLDDEGNKVDGATVTVTLEGAGVLAPLYSDTLAATPLGNPYVAADGADAGFYVTGGLYRIDAVKGLLTRTWRNVAVQSAGFADAKLTAMGMATPEDYGATGGADDTTYFIALASDINAGKVKRVECYRGRVYNVWPTTPSDQSILIGLNSGANGLIWNFNGASFNVGYTGNAITYVFALEGVSGVEIHGLNGTSAIGKETSGAIKGINWVDIQSPDNATYGGRNIRIIDVNLNGGLNGVNVFRFAGTCPSWSENIEITGTFTDVGYPVSNQSDGLNTRFDIATINAGRSYIGYNVSGVRGRIVATNSDTSLNDVEVACYGYNSDISQNTTSDIEIEYIDRASSVFKPSQLVLIHQQGDASHSDIPTKIANVHFDVDIVYTGTPSTSLMTMSSWLGNAAAQTEGDPGNTQDNIIISGTVKGDIGNSYLGYMMSSAIPGGSSGFGGTSKGTYVLRDLQVRDCTKPFIFGAGQVAVHVENVIAPSMASPSLDAGGDPQWTSFHHPVFFSDTGTKPVQGWARALLTNIAAPSTPASGKSLVYVDSTQKVLGVMNDGGTVSITVVPSTAPSHQFATAVGTGGGISYAQPAYSDISGSIPTDTALAGDLLATNIAAPGTPASGKTRIYVDSTQKVLSAKNDGGTVSVTIVPSTAPTHQFATAVGTGGGISYAQPAVGDISGGTALTKTDDTNVTLTLGGSPSAALLAAASLTLGWTGTLAVSRGGIGVGTLASTGLLKGNGASAVLASSNWTLSANDALAGAAAAGNTTISLSGSMTDVSQGILFNYAGTHTLGSATGTTIYGVNYNQTFAFSNASGSALRMNNYQLYIQPSASGSAVEADVFTVNGALAGASPTGTLTTFIGFKIGAYSYQHTGTPSFTISNAYGVQVSDFMGSKPSGVTITTAYGLYVAKQTQATTNYTIYAADGLSYLGGVVGFQSYTVSTLPSGTAAGQQVYASNVRVFNGTGTQEGAAAGTGGMVHYNGSNWKISGTNVTAVA